MANEMWLDERGEVIGTVSMGRVEELKRLEGERIEQVDLRRRFVEGRQYDDRNKARAEVGQKRVEDLPEHDKLHAYATQLSESVDFMATQMTESFSLEGTPRSLPVLTAALKASPQMKGGYGKSGISLTNLVRAALRDSDTPAWVRWDGVNDQAWVDVFDTKDVWFVYAQEDRNRLERVIVRQKVWDYDPATAEEKRRIQYREFFMAGQSCLLGTRWEGAESWLQVENLRVPFIPWVTLRANRKDHSKVRGESVVTRQAMEAALRYDAVEQTAYLIARYNSHGNLAVIGDGATLRAQMNEAIEKDVADVLTFPGGTAIVALTLPTDPQMIMHQREVLLDEMYGTFGLARLDHSTVQGLGNITGYALEILNRKSNGTFNQVKNQYVGDFKDLLHMILDVTAYRLEESGILEAAYRTAEDGQAEGNQIFDDEYREQVEARIWAALDELDPLTVFPQRDFEVHLGTGYVVDDVMIREDFTSNLISRASALRQRGWTKPEIETNQQEIDEEAPDEPEQGVSQDAVDEAASQISAARKNNPATEDSGE